MGPRKHRESSSMSGESSGAGKGLLERLSEGPVICAEGYLFELEHRGYVSAGAFVPEVVLEHPAAIEHLHREFLRAGSYVVEEGVDGIIAETFSWSEIALDLIRQTGLPSVITMAIHRDPETYEGLSPEDCCKRLEDAGADVVGLNCMRGPDTMLPMLRKIRLAVKCHVAALPVPYRTSDAEPTFHHLHDEHCSCLPDGGTFPTALDPFTCNRYEIAEFAKEAVDIGIHYLGVCCGAKPHHIRSMAEALGRRPPASKYSPDMSKHAYFGDSDVISEEYRELSTRL